MLGDIVLEAEAAGAQDLKHVIPAWPGSHDGR